MTTPTIRFEPSLPPRKFLALSLIAMAIGLITRHFRPPEDVAACHAAFEVAALAGERHVSGRGIDADVLAQANRKVAKRVVMDVPWMSADQAARLRRLAMEKPEELLERYRRRDCSLIRRFAGFGDRTVPRSASEWMDAIASSLDPHSRYYDGPAARGVLELVESHRRPGSSWDGSLSPSATVRTVGSARVAVIRVPMMTPDVPGEVMEAVREVGGSTAIDAAILDLRGNPGGSVPGSVQLAGLFLQGGPVTAIADRQGLFRIHLDEDASSIFSGPLVILVDGATASGAEIVAGALQARGRAVVVGSPRTFGKGSIQQIVLPGSGTGFLAITTGLYYLPDGRSPQLVGVDADVVLGGGAQDESREAGIRGALPHPQEYAPFGGPPGPARRNVADVAQALHLPDPSLAGVKHSNADVLEKALEIAARLAAARAPTSHS